MAPAPPAPSPPASGPPRRRCGPGSPPPWTAISSSPARTPGSAASSPAHSATSGPPEFDQVTIRRSETAHDQAARVPPATLSTTGHRRSQPRLTRKLKITSVQFVLGHAQLTTTQVYLTPRKEEVIRRVLAHHAEQTRQAAARTRPAPALGYRPETLDVLFRNGAS